MPYRAVLFDLDGTLLDSLEDLADSMNEALAALGFRGHPVASFKRFVGDGVANLARRALPPEHRDQETVTRCVAVMRRIYGGRWNRKTKPYEGVIELLSALAELELPCAVLSNKPDELTRTMVANLLAPASFVAVVGAKADVARKPDPTAALTIAHATGVVPSEWMYVGDTDTDMRTATGAGMYPVGVLWGFRDRDELVASGARTIVSTPSELLTIAAPPSTVR